jgi:type IV secretory pathway TrbL component
VVFTIKAAPGGSLPPPVPARLSDLPSTFQSLNHSRCSDRLQRCSKRTHIIVLIHHRVVSVTLFMKDAKNVFTIISTFIIILRVTLVALAMVMVFLLAILFLSVLFPSMMLSL